MPATLTIQTIGTRVSKWGEGPIWWDGHLLYVDIEGHKLIRLNPESGEEQSWAIGERIGTVVPRAEGGYLYAGDFGISEFDPLTGMKTHLADPNPTSVPKIASTMANATPPDASGQAAQHR